ncbi:uncharacterized protein DS421_5g154390 [Arachis hypogaea]|nr:uncharacterized protein DS421_5g154390 [Arachis hypogaea]
MLKPKKMKTVVEPLNRPHSVTPTLPVTNPNSLQHSLQRRSSRPSLVLPITLELAVPLNVGELSPSLLFSRRTTPDAVAGWSFEAHSVPHSANVSDSQQWKHSRRVRLLPPSRRFVQPSPALRFQRRHPSLHLNLRGLATLLNFEAYPQTSLASHKGLHK